MRSIALAVIAISWSTAHAQTWRIIPSISVTETWTDNVALDPSGTARSDLVSEITPGITFRRTGARSLIEGHVDVPVLLYAQTGSLNNDTYVRADVRGRWEAIEEFFFVDGEILISPSVLTPIGAQPVDLATVTENRYTSYYYRVSPYVRGENNQAGVQYVLRNDSIWVNQSGSPIATEDSYTSQWTGSIDTPVAPLGWHADIDFVSVKFENQDPQRTNVARAGARYAVTGPTRVSAHVGYEENRYPFSDYNGFVYGVGIRWRPQERTQLTAEWEHRFFGSSYLVAFEHRTPLSLWQFDASRLITSYPQQIGTLAAGSRVSAALNDLLSSRIPDPAQRQQAVEEFIQQRGLPSDLSGPVNVYTQQVTVDENLRASVGLFGARNSVLVTAYRLETQPVSGSGVVLPPALSFGADTTQVGANVVWTYRLTPPTNLNVTGDWGRTTTPGTSFSTRTTNAGAVVTTQLSPHLNAFAAIRWQESRSTYPAVTDYTESALLAGLRYAFR